LRAFRERHGWWLRSQFKGLFIIKPLLIYIFWNISYRRETFYEYWNAMLLRLGSQPANRRCGGAWENPHRLQKKRNQCGTHFACDEA
jgi:hypothetical protein